MTDIDLLSDTKDLLERTIEEGKSYNSFKKEAMELFEKKGWVGFKEVVNDKTGEKQTAELGTPRRLKTIYTSNINSAYAAGRYKEQLQEADIAPYWQYMTIADERTRDAHRAMHGKVFRFDDEFWNNFYPPNGWGCRCFVRNLSQREVDAAGLKVEQSKGKISEQIVPVGEDGKTVAVYSINDKDKLIPDAGWNHNIGKAAYFDDILRDKVTNMPEQVKELFYKEYAERKNLTPQEVKRIFTKKLPNSSLRVMNLNSKDVEVLQKYTNNSKPFNEPIMNKEFEKVKPLDDIFAKANKTTRPYTVYRGEGIGVLENIDFNETIKNFEQLAKLMKNPKSEEDLLKVMLFLNGKKVTQNLFMSTSFKPYTAKKYAKNKNPRLLWTITTKDGASAIDTRYLSSKKWEEELLFDRGQKLYIKDIKYDKRNKIWKITALVLF